MATPCASGYSQLAVSGTASLNGTLDISMVNGFTPTNGETFVILTSNGLGGTTFATMNARSEQCHLRDRMRPIGLHGRPRAGGHVRTGAGDVLAVRTGAGLGGTRPGSQVEEEQPGLSGDPRRKRARSPWSFLPKGDPALSCASVNMESPGGVYREKSSILNTGMIPSNVRFPHFPGRLKLRTR